MMLVLPSTLAGSSAAAFLWWQLRRRGMDRWLLPYLLEAPKRRPPGPADDVHVLLCVADHYEPRLDNASAEVARARVHQWLRHYPRRFGDLRDSDGRPPQHTFFVPLEEYVPEHIDALSRLCRWGFGEVEVHLHHDHDTAPALERKLQAFTELLAERHGLLSRRRDSGGLAYGFIHGNWALDNSRADGRWCGVTNELSVLRRTGCYADFTMPSAPGSCQTRKINSIYYAAGDPQRRMAHDTGFDVGESPAPEDALLLIQGPLLFDWSRRKLGIWPRLENGCLQANQPPSFERLRLWLQARVQVPQRPDWFFIKLHTHGAKEANQAVLLGEPMLRFHRSLAEHAVRDPRFHYHYVTAREMYNLVKAAEAGWQGSVADARDFEVVSNVAQDFVSLRCADTPRRNDFIREIQETESVRSS